MARRTSLAHKIYNALEQPRNKHFVAANNFLGAITAASVLAVILETVPQLAAWHSWFVFIEYTTVSIFLAEYAIRLYCSPARLSYVFSFFGLIDLIAILPTFAGLTNLTFLKAARAVRVMRTLRALRLVKVSRFSDKKAASQAVLGINFEIYTVLTLTAVVMLGTLLYTFEQSAGAPSIPHGMYWAFLAMIGGHEYPSPTTVGGTVTMVLVRFSALIFFGLVIGIMGAILRQKLTGSAEDVE